MSRAATASAYAYIAVRPTGGRRVGVRQARSLAGLAESLRQDNQLLLRSWALPGWFAREATMTLKDQAALNEQIGQLLTRGVPLVEALEVTAQASRPAIGPRVWRVREAVAGGTSFAEACRGVAGFDAVTIAVYRAAERTGDLAGATRQLAETARKRLRVSGKAATLMIYPAIVLSISVLVAAVMLVAVVPMIGEGLSQVEDIELPMYSKVITAAGTWARDNLTGVMLGLAGGAAGLLLVRGRIARAIPGLMRRIPLLRDVVVAQESARFFAVMGAMTRAGVPMADALGVANQAVGHPALARQLGRLRSRLVEGGVLRQLIDEVTQLPLGTRRLLIAAERAGDMEAVFTTLAGDMADEVERRSERMLAVLQPAIVVVMFVIIGSLIMAILLPLLTLAGRIGG